MGQMLSTRPIFIKMLPQSYQNCFQRQLKAGDYLTLQLLILVLQLHKQVSIEQLATVLP